MATKKNIIVTVDDDALKDIQKLAGRLTRKGMTVGQVMPITGVITGSCAPANISALESVTGVSSVEEELGVQLAPPDAPIQ